MTTRRPLTATGAKVVAIHGSALLDDVLGIEQEMVEVNRDVIERLKATVAARAAAPPVEPKPEWQWTDPEQTNAGAGLRLVPRLLEHEGWTTPEGDFCIRADRLEALLASDKPGLDVELLTDAMYEAGRKGLIYDGITNKDHAAVIAAEYERLSGGGS